MSTLKAPGYIVPFAKMRGKTSFASIATLKHLLGTHKVGHTGTLDSFADGLLVTVSGKLTRLAPFIEASSKRYEALLVFGNETDTLDLTGKVVKSADLPTYESIEKVLPLFIGKIMQVPPAFSALHIKGRRASDIVRSGGSVELRKREVNIKEILVKGVLLRDNEAFIDVKNIEGQKKKTVKKLHIEVECSKGTYIRALARDIGANIGSASYLKALRRLSVGCFSLQDAFCFSYLPNFLDDVEKSTFSATLPNLAKNEEGENRFTDETLDSYKKVFSMNLCKMLELPILEIKRDFVSGFAQGKQIEEKWFGNDENITYNMEEKREDIMKKGVGFIFYEDEVLGAIKIEGSRYKYKFVF